MRIFLGIDDTDEKGATLGTDRLARMMEHALPAGASLVGTVGHQLCGEVAGTSTNMATCAVVDCPPEILLPDLFHSALAYVSEHASPNSSPGLVAATKASPALLEFAQNASWRRMQDSELTAALDNTVWAKVRDGRGLVGAAAAVGLTAGGWWGRWLEYRGLHSFPQQIPVSDLVARGIRVVSLDRDAEVPCPSDWVDVRDYVRPHLLGGIAVILVTRKDRHLWESLSIRRTAGNRRRRPAPLPKK